ncbi:NAD-dependent epimerase/dehydratase family protein [Aureitalea marina]|uniref:3-beta hydroxysteroid dehydrogenase n=1 Tax=Aureitalea marina TaxID=930804 RepID=A0A2S7KMJ7_9FLAO|nr:NAD-dependent epimerase/dehydratase family protein [Aureitalea marina]PQB03847.1 3-beta hydroxysteroid dehydrogenase [Aureitalea marina]
MKVLITGAAGFIGSHTAERFKDMGHEVIAIDNFSDYYDVQLKERNASTLSKRGIEVSRLDLRYDPLDQLVSDCHMIVHFAAQPGISASCTFEQYLTNNVIATQRLLTAIEPLQDKPYFINIATSSIYGLHATMTEDQAPLPASWYGVTKLGAEQLVLAYSRRGLLRGCSVRLYSVYGPRERPDKLYTRLIAAGLKDEVFPLYEGSEKHLRSFTYVSDIVDGIVSIIDREEICNGEIFNLGTEEENTTATGIAVVEELLGKTIRKEITPPRPGDQARTCANIDKARRLLDYDPKTTLHQGLQKQIDWYRESFLN